jgi:hypothetical protein
MRFTAVLDARTGHLLLLHLLLPLPSPSSPPPPLPASLPPIGCCCCCGGGGGLRTCSTSCGVLCGVGAAALREGGKGGKSGLESVSKMWIVTKGFFLIFARPRRFGLRMEEIRRRIGCIC